jgi:hypothetical protein
MYFFFFQKSPTKRLFSWQYPFLFIILPCLLSGHLTLHLCLILIQGSRDGANFLRDSFFQNRTNKVEDFSEAGWSTNQVTGSPRTWDFIICNCLRNSSLDIISLHLFNTRRVVFCSTKLHFILSDHSRKSIPQFKANHNQFTHMHSTGKLIILLWILKRRSSV